MTIDVDTMWLDEKKRKVTQVAGFLGTTYDSLTAAQVAQIEAEAFTPDDEEDFKDHCRRQGERLEELRAAMKLSSP